MSPRHAPDEVVYDAAAGRCIRCTCGETYVDDAFLEHQKEMSR